VTPDRPLQALTSVIAATWATVVTVAMAAVVAATLAGWQLKTIDSPSMEPSVPEGSLAIVTPTAGDAIERGDVIAFQDPADPERHLLHRVIGETTLPDGRRFLQTQGDGNTTPDALPVASSAVDGELAWHLPNLGRVVWILRPPAGLLLLVGVPLVGMANTRVGRRIRRRRRTPTAATLRSLAPT
jgi:signal peptidase